MSAPSDPPGAAPLCPAAPPTDAGAGSAAAAWLASTANADIGEEARQAHNAAFERDELARFSTFFETVLPQPLNAEQRAAIVVDEDATLVVAAAGSGKTTLLLGKIAYLVMRGLARPHEIALLAFNNSVRAEIAERLAASHPGVAVHTFHSLGLDIVRAASAGACRLSPMATDNERLRDFVGDALLALAEREPHALGEWLAAQFRPLRQAADFPAARDFAAWVRRNPPLTLLGPRVAGEPQREVADRLTLAGIACRLDAALPLAPALPMYRPQLLLPDARVAIDLADAGRAAGQGARPSGPGLARRVGMELLARLACWRHGLSRVRLADADALQRDGRLGSALAERLAPLGLDLTPREIGPLARRPAAAARLQGTATLLATCITLHRGCAHPASASAASASAPAAGDAPRLAAFDTLFRHVLQAYEAHLRARGEIDFNDMIVRAAGVLDAARLDPLLWRRLAPRAAFRYLLVDEFQDISAGRAELLKALQRSQPGVKLLAVGDDWQSIYRFAGSDVGIMTRFAGYFGRAETRFLRQTFRFDRRLESVASAFVLRNPAQIRKQVEAREPTSDAPSVVLWWPPDGGADDPLPGVARDLFGEPVADPGSAAPAASADALPEVLILGRYRSLEAQARLDWLHAHYPQARWRFSTMHRAKGATADYAVILGVRGGRQPFPADRPDDPLLAHFLGAVEAFPQAEERRLFYVALTRARQRVYVVGDLRQPSPFFEELLQRAGDIAVHHAVPVTLGAPAVPRWDNLPPCSKTTA